MTSHSLLLKRKFSHFQVFTWSCNLFNHIVRPKILHPVRSEIRCNVKKKLNTEGRLQNLLKFVSFGAGNRWTHLGSAQLQEPTSIQLSFAIDTAYRTQPKKNWWKLVNSLISRGVSSRRWDSSHLPKTILSAIFP